MRRWLVLMAYSIVFVCDNCAKDIEAWDDGNPYFLDSRGEKQYAHHPDPDRDRCIGNDMPHLCSSCGHEFDSDSLAPSEHCPACASPKIVETWNLANVACPFCKHGHFRQDRDRYSIS